MRRMLTGGLAVFAVAAIALTGCKGTGTDARSVDHKPAADKPEADKPRARLQALGQSYRKIENESFTFTSTMTVDGRSIESTGAFDLAKKVGSVRTDFGGRKSEIRVIGSDMYLNMMSKWMHIDLTRLPAGNAFADAGNPIANADLLLAASEDVEEIGDGEYKGTLDVQTYLNRYAKPEEAAKLKKSFGDLGPEAMKVPFEATVDDQGRLTSLQTTMKMKLNGQVKTLVQDTKYSDFGTQVSVARPPANQIEEAPESIYKM